jgi:hypothetical protein
MIVNSNLLQKFSDSLPDKIAVNNCISIGYNYFCCYFLNTKKSKIFNSFYWKNSIKLLVLHS